MDDTLYKALIEKGFPEEYCRILVTRYLNTDYTRNRMLGYLYRYDNPSIEDVTDEMLAILSDRDAIIRKHELEHAQSVINDVYNNGLSQWGFNPH